MTMQTISRRTLLKGTGAVSAASLVATYPRALLIRAQGSAEYDLIDFGPFDVEVTDGRLRGFGDIYGINSAGMSCGWVGVSVQRASPAVWSASGKRKRLKSGKGGGAAWAVNDDGVVVGYEIEGEDTRPVVWRDGEPIELPDLTGDTASARGSARAISSDGVIAGFVGVDNSWQAVRWVRDVAEALPDSPDGPARNVYAMNDNGTMLASVLTEETFPRTFGIWRGDEVAMIELPEEVTDDHELLARALNERDMALLSVYMLGGGSTDFFFFITDGETTTIVDGRGDGYASVATDLNDDGVVVGQTFVESADRSAAIWRDGEHADLNTLVTTDSGLTLINSSAINNDGMIAATGRDADGLEHGVLLIPAS